MEMTVDKSEDDGKCKNEISKYIALEIKPSLPLMNTVNRELINSV